MENNVGDMQGDDPVTGKGDGAGQAQESLGKFRLPSHTSSSSTITSMDPMAAPVASEPLADADENKPQVIEEGKEGNDVQVAPDAPVAAPATPAAVEASAAGDAPAEGKAPAAVQLPVLAEVSLRQNTVESVVDVSPAGENVCSLRSPHDREVEVSIHVHAVPSIYEMAQTFCIDMSLAFVFEARVEWRNAGASGLPVDVPNGYPEVYVTHSQDPSVATTFHRPMERTFTRGIRGGDATEYIFMAERHRTTLWTEMKFRLFPMDEQVLKVVVLMRDWRNHADVRPLPSNGLRVGDPEATGQAPPRPPMESCFKDFEGCKSRLSDWYLHEGVVETYTLDMASRRSRVEFSMRVSRNYWIFFFHVVALLVLVQAVAFSAIAIPIQDVSGRQSIGVVLMLTIITFKLWLSNYFPRFDYFTCFDMYLLVAFCTCGFVPFSTGIIVFIVRTENRTATRTELLDSLHERRRVDNVVNTIFASAWCVLHIILFIAIVVRALQLRRIMSQKLPCCEQELQDLVDSYVPGNGHEQLDLADWSNVEAYCEQIKANNKQRQNLVSNS